MQTEKPAPSAISVFFSYAHEDEKLRDRLATHLSLLKRQGTIADWSDRDITAGTEWKGQIDARLMQAQIVLLLISSDFLASEYCYDVEMKRALERHEHGEARVIPIFLRPVDWEGAPFGKLQGLPTDTRPVTTWKNRDEAFENIAKGIRAAATELGGNAASARSGKAVSGRERPLADPRPETAAQAYNRGIRLLAGDDYDGALEALDRALALDPTIAYAFYNRGLAHDQKGDLARAIADFDEALRLGFSDALLFRNRGNAYSRNGDVVEALADYQRAIELDPASPLTYLNRAEVYRNTLRTPLAIKDLKKVLRLPCDETLRDLARQRLLALGVRAK
jgi:tetratricopeptide (TPR) repeat protein